MLSMIEPATGASQRAQPFSARHERFRDGLTPNDWAEFAGSTDDEQRVRFVYERTYGEETADDNVDDNGCKNGAETLALKRSGTECFQKSDYRDALDWYSRAVLRCPQTKEWLLQLSIIYANRSACLYHLGDYDLAIADIQQALDNGYPKDLRYKIYDRRAKCFLATKQLKSAMESFKTTVRALDDSKLSPDERRKRQLDVEATLSTITARDGKNVRNEPAVKSGRRSWPKLYGEPNETHPSASDAVSVVYDEAVGRHAIARRDVPVGKVLLVERAYASVLLEEYSHSHCTHCFVKLVAPLPCPDCDRVAFCGEPCKRTALRSYHAIECPLLPAVYATGVSITCLMALRIITQRPLKYFVDLRPKLNHTYNPCGKHEPENYLNLYNLVTHRETRSTQDVLHRSHLVAFYLSCLKRTNYFPPTVDRDRLTEDESFVGSLLLHHLMLLPFNSFEVSELKCSGDEEQTVFIGGSVYPTLAMLNHSCNPCIVRYHRGTTVVVQNVRDLKAGEEITENYGPTFTLHPREDRQQTLKTRYWFECNCIACSQDWPTWEQMLTNTTLRIRCKNCRNAITVNMESMAFTVNCKVCSKTTNLLAALKVLQDTDEKYMAAKQLMDKHDYEKALPEFMALLSLLHKHMVPPFKDYHLCQQAIGRCILSLGNQF